MRRKLAIAGGVLTLGALAFLLLPKRPLGMATAPLVGVRVPPAAVSPEPRTRSGAGNTVAPPVAPNTGELLDVALPGEEQRLVLTGVVLFDGAAVAGAQVEVQEEHRVEHLTTGPDGTFTVPGLRRARYEVVATFQKLEGQATADLTSGTTLPVEILLSELALLTGRVTDVDDRPIRDARVEAARRRANRETTNDDAGHYRLDLPVGDWTLLASAEGYLRSSPTTAEVSPNEATEQDFVLVQASTVSGLVVDTEGNPVARASLRLRSERASSKEDGSFSLSVEAGTWTLTASHDRFPKTTQEVTVPSDGVRVVLEPGATITGRVLDARGAPLSEASVAARGEKVRRSDRSNGEGRFELRGLSAGEYVVTATRESENATHYVTEKVRLREQETREVELRFPAGESISGRVIDRAGAPVKQIEAIALNGTSELVTTTDEHGRFVFEGATPPRYRLEVDRDRVRMESPVGADPGDRDVTIVVSRRATVTGRVLDPSGKPVRVFNVDLAYVRSEDGVFHHPVDENFISPLAITADGYAPKEIPIEVQTKEIQLGDVVLDPGRTVRGRVVDAETNEPIAGARVLADRGFGPHYLEMQAEISGVLASSLGEFVLQNVSQEGARVGVSHPDYPTTLVTLSPRDATPTIRLTRGAVVTGRVVGADGRGRSLPVFAINDSADRFVDARSDDDGLFRFRALTAGRWSVRAEPFGEAGASFEAAVVTVPQRGEVFVELRERTGGTNLTLRFLQPGGAPAPVVAMLFQGAHDIESAQTVRRLRTSMLAPASVKVTQSRFVSLPPGSYTLLVIPAVGLVTGARRYLVQPLELATPGEQTLDVVLDPASMRTFPVEERAGME